MEEAPNRTDREIVWFVLDGYVCMYVIRFWTGTWMESLLRVDYFFVRASVRRFASSCIAYIPSIHTYIHTYTMDDGSFA